MLPQATSSVVLLLTVFGAIDGCVVLALIVLSPADAASILTTPSVTSLALLILPALIVLLFPTKQHRNLVVFTF